MGRTEFYPTAKPKTPNFLSPYCTRLSYTRPRDWFKGASGFDFEYLIEAKKIPLYLCLTQQLI